MEEVTTGIKAAPLFPKKKKKFDIENATGTFMASIPLIGFAIFGLIPMVLAFVMSGMQIYGFSFANSKWIGFDNFKAVLTDNEFWRSIKNTVYMGLSMPISLVLSLVVAFLLDKEIKFKKFFRTVFFIPYVCSVVAVTLMWKWIFNTNFGVLNQWLGRTGDNAIDWIGNSKYYIWAVIIMSVWSGTGFGIILFAAALTNVNKSLTEAAKIDGANNIKCFWNITLPSISPTTFYLFTIGLIGVLQSFAVTNILTEGGGPNNVGVTVVFYLYRRIFNYAHMMGQASAVAILLTILILIVTVINFWASKKWVSYD